LTKELGGLVGKDNISFIAALNNATAIKVDGEGEVKVTFQVSADQLPEVIKLVLYVDKTFKVVIEDDK
jgi:hypothetical protein